MDGLLDETPGEGCIWRVHGVVQQPLSRSFMLLEEQMCPGRTLLCSIVYCASAYYSIVALMLSYMCRKYVV